MARELITRVWCDLCLGRDETHEEAVHTDEIRLGGGPTKPRMLETCERHYKEVVEPLLDALRDYGTIVSDTAIRQPQLTRRATTPDPDGPYECGVPGCFSEPLSSKGSFSSHLRKQHGLTLRQYRAEQGGELTTPATAAPASSDDQPTLPTDDDDDQEFPCTEPGCDKVYSRALGNNRPAQALGIHRARAHGIRSERVASA